MIRAVVFDADETLLDLRPAVTGGLLAVLEEMRRLTPAAGGVSLADLESDWGAVFRAQAADPVQEIRRVALARSLGRAGLAEHLESFATLFYTRRFALTRPYPDVLPALAELRPRFTLGYATNGNSRAGQCGLAGEFAFERYAHENGLPKKPAPEFFAEVAAAAGSHPTEVLYVGDSLALDVVAPQAVGMRAVWLNRAGTPRPDGVRPDAEITTLADLPAVVRLLDVPVTAGSRPVADT
ncbi:HAD family hydrolase [Micromonospora sagamiensis]|uniref:Putative hydrolase of the HAD superfamily n=1 Tax=Micromonospora sagamiensis TaxID=47875 RepID=A0A562W955_9ACTN|nr:HAD family hydrolase [Micromonospora sagamiensis]TWJ26790.1 putative hydrolase of the HAD superfamily [Micromonospora sagamiensis]BCL14323.1 hydrolase [Micromonospora sagamiensis]